MCRHIFSSLKIKHCTQNAWRSIQTKHLTNNSKVNIVEESVTQNTVLYAVKPSKINAWGELATFYGSCWEGVDFPGDMVSSLIIVKLPFSVPDPIHEAQREQYRSLKSYIQTIVVPDMQKKLRQGFGRAIRTEQDTCVVSILDHRATKKGRYRSDVLEALPKCQMAERIEEVEDFIRSRKVERYYSWEHPWRCCFCPDLDSG